MRKGVVFRFAFVMTLHEKILQDLFALIPHLGHCVVDQCSPGIVFLVRTVFRTAFIFGILIVIIMGRVRPRRHGIIIIPGPDASPASRHHRHGIIIIGITRFLWRRTLRAIIVSVSTILIFVPSKIIIGSNYLSTILTVTPSMITKPYPEFNFRHKFSILVVGPTQSGKTYFVQQILKHNRIVYEEQKSIRIFWCYNQWQECYEELKTSLGKSIQFERGLPELSENLCEINARYNNIIILDDLMAEATDSPVVSRLFTQGHHRSASVMDKCYVGDMLSSRCTRHPAMGSILTVQVSISMENVIGLLK